MGRAWGMLPVVLLLCASCHSRVPEPDGERALRDLKALTELGPRYPGAPARKAALDFITAGLKDAGADVRIDHFTHRLQTGGEIALDNIEASFGRGDEPAITVCAHWDTRPRSEKDPDPALRDRPMPGANDGASGVAVLLEIGRCLGKSPPPRRVDLVFFDGEDYGDFTVGRDVLLGSRRYAPRAAKAGLKAAVLLDMVGDKNLQLPVEGTSLARAPELTRAFYRTARDLGFGDVFALRSRYTIIDDHVSLLDAGIQAVDIIDFDYRYFHTTQDTSDKCAPASLATVAAVVLRFVHDFDPKGLPPARDDRGPR